MSKHLLPAIIGSGFVLLSSVTVFAQDFSNMSCDDLWYARNQIYSTEGYCFKTARARAEFGRSCFPPYGKLSRYEQQQVNEIQNWEARYGCD